MRGLSLPWNLFHRLSLAGVAEGTRIEEVQRARRADKMRAEFEEGLAREAPARFAPRADEGNAGGKW